MSNNYSIYTPEYVAELKAAFELVEPKDNWKNPIDAFVPRPVDETRLDKIVEAIIFYTGSVPTLSFAVKDHVFGIHITAAGYYAAVGA